MSEDDLLGRMMDKYVYMRAEFVKAKKKAAVEEEDEDWTLEESSNWGVMKQRAKTVSGNFVT